MSRRGAWEPVAAIVGLLVLAAVGVWWWFEVLEPPRAPVPGYKGQPFAALSAAMPEIAQFEGFYINDDNPFVPWREREAEARKLKEPKNVVVVQKPRPPAKIEITEPPKLILPAKAAGGGDAPKVLGFHRTHEGTVKVIAQLPGETKPHTMAPGEKAGRWQFVEIEAGNIAVFKDETERVYRLVIGTR
jgi:hypothetical protein